MHQSSKKLLTRLGAPLLERAGRACDLNRARAIVETNWDSEESLPAHLPEFISSVISAGERLFDEEAANASDVILSLELAATASTTSIYAGDGAIALEDAEFLCTLYLLAVIRGNTSFIDEYRVMQVACLGTMRGGGMYVSLYLALLCFVDTYSTGDPAQGLGADEGHIRFLKSCCLAVLGGCAGLLDSDRAGSSSKSGDDWRSSAERFLELCADHLPKDAKRSLQVLAE